MPTPDALEYRPLAPGEGFEPPTKRLTVAKNSQSGDIICNTLKQL